MPRVALFYALFWISSRVTFSRETVAKVAKYGSLRPSVVVCCSQLVVSLGEQTTGGFGPFNDRKGKGMQKSLFLFFDFFNLSLL